MSNTRPDSPWVCVALSAAGYVLCTPQLLPVFLVSHFVEGSTELWLVDFRPFLPSTEIFLSSGPVPLMCSEVRVTRRFCVAGSCIAHSFQLFEILMNWETQVGTDSFEVQVKSQTCS